MVYVPAFHCLKMVHHIFWECPFSKCCRNYLEDQYSVILQYKLHWWAAVLEMAVLLLVPLSISFGIAFGFQRYLSFGRSGLSLFLRMSIAHSLLSVLYGAMRSSTSSKGALLVKDAQSLDQPAYSDFLSALVMVQNRWWGPLYITFHFSINIGHLKKVYIS